ncbi:MAG: putative Ig domain-containing protein [Proteobacteria bacterium]|nr:putative Ig domain-containing protein [Pseudomonadota bacterium]
MTENYLTQRAPRWRVLLSSLAIAGAWWTQAQPAEATTTTLTISGTPPSTVAAGSTYTFTPTVTGSGGRTLSFAIVQKPSWATFNSATGTLTGKPTSANVGTYKSIEIGVNNGLSSAISNVFSIQVTSGSTTSTPPPTTSTSGPLTISGTPASSVAAGSAYSFTPTTSGSGGRTLSFSIVQKPSWASFSSTTGQLSGTPTSANVGSYPSIEIMVNNGLSVALLKTFAIQVTSSGTTSSASTVTISGTPPSSVTATSKYSFQPTAKDSAGKALSYSVKNAPSWASFSIASGLLSGTPTTAQVGTYSGILITASDGTASSSLPSFAITVKSLTSTTGSATLSWTDPTKNTDGSPLTNLAGVNIHYGSSPSALTQTIQVAGTSLGSYTISNLTAGTWYFGAAAYTTSGVEGAMSNIGNKTIQ